MNPEILCGEQQEKHDSDSSDVIPCGFGHRVCSEGQISVLICSQVQAALARSERSDVGPSPRWVVSFLRRSFQILLVSGKRLAVLQDGHAPVPGAKLIIIIKYGLTFDMQKMDWIYVF